MKRIMMAALLAVFVFAFAPVRAADDAKDANDAKDGKGGKGDAGKNDPGNMRSRWAGMAGALGGGNMLADAASRMGIDIHDPKTPKLDALPLGVDKRFVLNIPVGGVDNPSGTGNGWKMEAIFKMTDEQTKSVDALRDEYKGEQKKLDVDILDQQKVLAAKVTDLRQKFEKRANDILTGADKEAKQKMDALMQDSSAKGAAVVADTLPLYDVNDMAQGFAMIRAIQEKKSKISQDTTTAFLDLVPAESKPKIAEALKEQNAARDQMGRMGRRGNGGDQPGKPPLAPPQAPPGNF